MMERKEEEAFEAMRILVAEDDFSSRKLITSYLNEIGECDVAMDGEEAVEAVRLAINEHRPYRLICLDIMMPNLDGQNALRLIREMESEAGILAGMGAKIVMTTSLSDVRNISEAYRKECNGYIAKPIKKEKLIMELSALGLV